MVKGGEWQNIVLVIAVITLNGPIGSQCILDIMAYRTEEDGCYRNNKQKQQLPFNIALVGQIKREINSYTQKRDQTKNKRHSDIQ